MTLANDVALEQSFNVYIKKAGTFDQFIWAGDRVRLDAQPDTCCSLLSNNEDDLLLVSTMGEDAALYKVQDK